MRIPACHLLEHLSVGVYEVRAADYTGFNAALPYTEAVSMAIRGEIEGVATPSGRIKYLRMLPENERTPAPEAEETPKESKGSILAQTRMGAYRQKVYSSQMDTWGDVPTVIVIGEIWQLHGVHI